MASFDEIFGGSGNAPIWVSGTTYTQFQRVIDPVDGRLFFRRTAAGSGTTRPALDFTNYSLPGFPSVPITKIGPTNNFIGYDTNANANPFSQAIQSSAGTYATLAISSTTYLTAISFTGRGVIDFAAGVSSNGNVTAYRLTIDDVVIYTQAGTASVTGQSVDMILGGLATMNASPPTARGILPEEVFFSRNFKLEIQNGAASGSYIYGFRHRLLS